MSTAVYTATGCSYNNNGNWADSKRKNPVYLGNNSSGTYAYIGQFVFPTIDNTVAIAKIELNIYRTSSSATYTREQFYGSTSDLSDYGSVLSTGQTISITGGEGWKTVDISAIIDQDAPFAGEWALLVGNPNDNGTYCVVAGYGSGYVPYLTVYHDDGTKVHYGIDSDTATTCKVYRATSATELQRCDVYYGTSATTAVKIMGV